jgi:hypothetical protein
VYENEGAEAAHATTVSVAETEEALRLADEMRRREQALLTRERELSRREQAIQVQQRVVEEEARLLASNRMSRPTAASPIVSGPATTGSVATITAPVGSRQVTAPTPAPNRAPSAYVTPAGVRVQRLPPPTVVRQEGWWDRVRRIVFRVTESETGA